MNGLIASSILDAEGQILTAVPAVAAGKCMRQDSKRFLAGFS
jgi:hypothetical protein